MTKHDPHIAVADIADRFEFPNTKELVLAAMQRVFEPPAPVLPAKWMQEELVTPDGPRAGQLWDAALTPYVAPIVNAMAPDSPHNRAAVRKSAQTGLSIAGIGLVGSWIDKAPAKNGLRQREPRGTRRLQ